MRRITAVKIFALAAAAAGIIALGATAAHADETVPPPAGTVATPSPTPTVTTHDNNPWD